MTLVDRGEGTGDARDARPGGQNSFIFMHFSPKKFAIWHQLGSCRPHLGKILDPPLNVLLLEMSNCVCISNQNDLHQNYSLCRSKKNVEYCEMPLVLSSSGILVSFAHVYLSILIMCALYVALILTLRKQQKDLVWKIDLRINKLYTGRERLIRTRLIRSST